MFKKVVLSGLLSVSMLFSIGVPAGAEMADVDEVVCKRICEITQKNEDMYRKNTVKLEEAINTTEALKFAELRNYYSYLSDSFRKNKFNEKENHIKNAIKDYDLAVKDKAIECYNKEIDVIKNTIRLIIGEFYKNCPNFYCEFKTKEGILRTQKDEEVKNSILAKKMAETNKAKVAATCGENEFYNANTNTCECIHGFAIVNGECREKIACGKNEAYNADTNTCECK